MNILNDVMPSLTMSLISASVSLLASVMIMWKP